MGGGDRQSPPIPDYPERPADADFLGAFTIFAVFSLVCMGAIYWFTSQTDTPLFIKNIGYIDKNVKYSTWLQASGKIQNTACSMCSEQFTPDENLWLVKSCKHAFHEVCENGRNGLRPWLQKNDECHFCKGKYPEDPLRDTLSMAPSKSGEPKKMKNSSPRSAQAVRFIGTKKADSSVNTHAYHKYGDDICR